jgi:hypothetical protein
MCVNVLSIDVLRGFFYEDLMEVMVLIVKRVVSQEQLFNLPPWGGVGRGGEGRAPHLFLFTIKRTTLNRLRKSVEKMRGRIMEEHRGVERTFAWEDMRPRHAWEDHQVMRGSSLESCVAPAAGLACTALWSTRTGHWLCSSSRRVSAVDKHRYAAWQLKLTYGYVR